MKTLRKERETLLTLLEAFVYDPLVDWAVNEDGVSSTNRITQANQAASEILALSGGNKTNVTVDPKSQKIQNIKQITDSIKAKCSEFKKEWRAYSKEYTDLFEKTKISIDEYISIEEQISLKEPESDFLKRQIDYVDVPKEMIDSNTLLKSLPKRFKTYKDGLESFNQNSTLVDNRIKELKEKMSDFKKVSKPSFLNLKTSLQKVSEYKVEERPDIKAALSKSATKKNSYERFMENSEKVAVIQKESLTLIQQFLHRMDDYFEATEYCIRQGMANRRYETYLFWIQNPEKMENDLQDLNIGQVAEPAANEFEICVCSLEKMSRNIDALIAQSEKATREATEAVSLSYLQF